MRVTELFVLCECVRRDVLLRVCKLNVVLNSCQATSLTSFPSNDDHLIYLGGDQLTDDSSSILLFPEGPAALPSARGTGAKSALQNPSTASEV